MNGFPWLTVAGALPLAGALVISLIPGLPADSAEADRRARDALAKMLALAFSVAAKTPIIIVSSTSISAKYVFGDRRSSGLSASCHEARITTGISTAVIPISTSAIPSTPTA